MEDHPMRKITKRSAAIAAAAVIAVGGGAAAFASGWLIDGTGTATATGAEAKPLTAAISLSGKAYPGAKLKAIARVSNPNEFPVIVNQFTGASNFTATRGGTSNADCLTALGTAGPSVVVPVLPATPPKISQRAVNQQVEMDLTIGDSFPLACADTIISADIAFKGNSSVA
jgi:hypothetical protein